MVQWRARRFVEIFRRRSFRRFWLGYTGSLLGDAMTRVALVWFVYERTRSAPAVGWLMLCYTGPVVVSGFLAGLLLDRFGRRRVMIADAMVRGLTMAAIPLLHAAGALALWHVYAAAVVYGLLMMISLAGGPALVPSLVRPEHLATANALEMLGFTTVGVVGPPLAGWLLTWMAGPNLLVLDALSYGAFALTLASLGPLEAGRPARGTEGAGARHHLGEAVRLLVGSPVLLATTVMFLAYNVGNGALSVWLPVMADRVLGGGSRLYGGLLGAMAAGQVASALLAGGVTVPVSLGLLICAAQALAGVALLLLLLLGGGVWGAAGCLVLYGAASAPLTIWAQTLRMRIIPEALRGRAFALLRMLMQGGAPIGGALAGWLLPVLGIPALIAWSAAFAGVPGLLGARVGALRRAGAPGDARGAAASGSHAAEPGR